MYRDSVSSSNLASVGYDAETRVLEIEFLSGGVYQYYGVSYSVYQGLMAAPSHGTFFNRAVKQAGFRWQRIT